MKLEDLDSLWLRKQGITYKKAKVPEERVLGHSTMWKTSPLGQWMLTEVVLFAFLIVPCLWTSKPHLVDLLLKLAKSIVLNLSIHLILTSECFLSLFTLLPFCFFFLSIRKFLWCWLRYTKGVSGEGKSEFGMPRKERMLYVSSQLLP